MNDEEFLTAVGNAKTFDEFRFLVIEMRNSNQLYKSINKIVGDPRVTHAVQRWSALVLKMSGANCGCAPPCVDNEPCRCQVVHLSGYCYFDCACMKTDRYANREEAMECTMSG
jgi:hypothetical protein